MPFRNRTLKTLKYEFAGRLSEKRVVHRRELEITDLSFTKRFFELNRFGIYIKKKGKFASGVVAKARIEPADFLVSFFISFSCECGEGATNTFILRFIHPSKEQGSVGQQPMYESKTRSDVSFVNQRD